MAVDQRVGTVLAGYRILEQLGSGGTSVVYRAEHVRLGRAAALKLLTPGLGEADFSERFLRESQLAASLDHPSIVPVYDAGEEDGLLYIAMACVEGRDLKTLFAEEGRLAPRRALRIVGQIAAALDAAHARGLVHRDVKPANILVTEDDRAYLSDFGVVKELTSNGATRTGTFIGTIEYCAPEQIEGNDVDARTDVYALACVLFECLAGEPPFHRPSEVAVLNAHLHAPPAKLSRAAPDVPPALEHVIAKALSKSPLDRYPSTGEFLNAARAGAAERRVHRRRLAVSVSLLVTAALLGAAAALGIHAAVDKGAGATSEPTRPGPPPPPAASLDTLLIKSNDGRTLNDIAYALMGAHDYQRALPFARKAVRKATPGTLTYGFASFNLGFTLLKLDRCAASLPPLKTALGAEPASYRPYIRPRIKEAQKCIQRARAGQGPSR